MFKTYIETIQEDKTKLASGKVTKLVNGFVRLL